MPATRVAPARAAVLGIAVAAAIGLLPAPVGAASAIPTEQAGQALDGQPITAIVGDVDGDGIRELVTLGPRRDDPVHLAVQVMAEQPDGRVASLGSAPLARMASVTEQLSGLPRPDEDNLLQARVDEPARLIAWHDNGREHVLALAIGTLRNARACCLSIWAVERGGEGIRLRLMTDTMRSANQVRAVDMDADGTDELVVTEPLQDARPGVMPIAVLRWTGERFSSQTATVPALGSAPLIPLGDSDGLPGDEAGLLRAEESGATLARIALRRDGRLRVEMATLPFGGSLVPLAGPDGGRLVLGDDGHATVLVGWRAGGRDVVEARSPWLGVPIGTVGRGAAAGVVKIRDDRLLDVFGARLGTIRTGTAGTGAEARFREAGIQSYAGPLPGGLPGGRDAFIYRGRIVSTNPPGADGEVVVAEASALPGSAPIGLFGLNSELLAIARAGTMSLPLGFDATREGGQLEQPAGGLRTASIVVANATSALAPEADAGLLQPDPQGPVRVEAGVDEPEVLAGGSFTLPVSAPPGTQLQLRVGEAVTDTQVPQGGVAQVPVATEDYEDGDEVRVTLLAITPAGQGYGAAWTVAIHTRPPALRASTPFAPLGFDVSVSGQTAPDASVAVDGAPVPVAADGRFDAAVSAGLWPRDVQIHATDPLGNRTTTTVSVVALVDYRQLPWIPIVALLTIVAGIVLYLRVPHARPQAASGPIADATLEDLD